MPISKSKPSPHSTAADTTQAVNDFLRQLDHPFKAEIEVIRRIVLGSHSSVAEGIKWNAPSFRTTEYFATTNLRTKDGIGIVLHLGAKVRETAVSGIVIDDPAGLLKWLAKDRATIVFADANDIAAKRTSFTNILRQWIAHV